MDSASLVAAQSGIATLLAGGALLCFVGSLQARRVSAAVDKRIATFVGAANDRPQVREERPSFRQRVVTPLASWMAAVAGGMVPERQMERIRHNLAVGGLARRRDLTYFLAAKVGLALGLAALFALYGTGDGIVQSVVAAPLGAVLGFYAPGVWLGRRIARRKVLLFKALPDALDLLSVSVGAGLGFDGAMAEVVQQWQNPLTDEFSMVLRDLRLGKSRRDALHDLAERTEVPEIDRFVAAVVQSDQLGTSIRSTLQVQAEQIRLQRRHRAEEQARKAAVKMLVPIALFIFPTLFVVLLGPALPSLAALAQ